MGGKDGLPVCGYYWVGFYVYAFGFGLLADAGEGGFVFLFLEGACHVDWFEGGGRISSCFEGGEQSESSVIGRC